MPYSVSGSVLDAAWRAVRRGAAWRRVYEGIRERAGVKKAIVAVARRLLCELYAMLRDGTDYNLLKVGEPPPA